MTTVSIHKINECFVKVLSEPSVESDIRDYFTFKVPGHQFSPKFKARLWDGTISLFNIRTKLLPIGLYNRLAEYCKDNGITIEFVSNDNFTAVTEPSDIDIKDVKDFVDSLNIWSKNGPITPREYQLDAIHRSIVDRKITLISPTSSGKSMIIYCIIRWILEEDPDARVLLLVPSVSLVNQMMGDFREYAGQSGFNVDTTCQKLYSGQNRELSKRVLITTWQSFTKIANDKSIGPKVLSLYRGVIADEAHTSAGKEMQSILEKCVHADYRIGTTGTIDNSKIHQLVIEGFLGPIYRVTTTRELMDQNQVSNLKIKALILKYPLEVAKFVATAKKEDRKSKPMEYQDEIKWLITNQERNDIIRKVSLSLSGTTLILVRNRDTHAKVLYEQLKESAKKPVHYVAGDVKADARELIRLTANVEDCIIVATYQTMSVGVNIPNIRNVIFGSPSKSAITVLQSIGRGLRLHADKEHMTLIDIIDDLRYKSRENFAYLHAIERLTIYKKEQFEIGIKEINIATS